jgi:predicted esterase
MLPRISLMFARHSIVLVLITFVACSTLHAADAPSCRSLSERAAPVATIETTLAGVPALLRVPKTITKPPIVLWHGFGPPASEQALMEALPLDDVPAIKVYLGLPLFGKRAEAGGVEALKRRQAQDFATQIFEPVVVGAAKELPAVVNALQTMGCMQRGERIGLFGFSGGGAAVLFALAEHAVPISSAVILNASTGLSASIAAFEKATGKPYPWTDASRALARRTDAATRAGDIASGHPPAALLIVQGTADETLTPQNALDLNTALEAKYSARDSKRLQLALSTGLSHNVTDTKSLTELRKWTGDWFNQWDVAAKARSER